MFAARADNFPEASQLSAEILGAHHSADSDQLIHRKVAWRVDALERQTIPAVIQEARVLGDHDRSSFKNNHRS